MPFTKDLIVRPQATPTTFELSINSMSRPEAMRHAAEAIPVLDGFNFRSEALAARRLLAEALARERVTPEVLRRVRAVLSRLVWDPAVRSPKEC